MLAELGMDWLVELTSEHYYGPTTLGAIAEFIRLGEINEDTFVINSCDGMRRQISELTALLRSAREKEPAATGIASNVRERIRDLEQTLREERRVLEEAEQRYAELERKYQELLQQQR
jgi:chromosome segregation ATPase